MKNLWLLLLVVSMRPVHAQLFGGQIKSPRAIISQLNCANATVSATVYDNVAINGINVTVPIVASNGGTYISQTFNSTGVIGLILTSGFGMITSGSSNLIFSLSGTANTAGTALFNLAIGGQTCSISVVVVPFANQYPANSVFCANGPTAIVDVTNPTTGKTWMDRNLGASQVATSSTNNNAYGDLYQWGRRADGHQCRTSPTTATLSSVDQPAHGSFILAPNAPYNWRSPQNTNLWQGVNGVNNPCPSGYRIPTETELDTERLSWSQNNSVGAFASPLKWTLAGYRDYNNGSLNNVGSDGFYWSSAVSGTNSRALNFYSSSAAMYDSYRASGLPVRCLKDASAIPAAVGALNCGSATLTGNLYNGSVASGVSASVPYTAGNGGSYGAQSVSSTGVAGLTASLSAGTLANGAGSLTYTISGTPTTSGTATFAITVGGQSCSFTISVAVPSATLTTINCGSATITGTLTSGTAASGVSVSVPYTGGNAGTYGAQSVSSTGVVGLTAALSAGTLANGAGSLTYTITGTPTTSGTASFAITVGGQSCSFTVSVAAAQPQYPAGTVNCAGATTVVDVTNPTTGKIWMDRNLGATQVATSITDVASYGDLYQWGRRADGHQCRTSATTATLSSIDQPAQGNFILAPNAPYDWRSPQNANLWQGVNGVNNPCPSGYRIPTETELNSERLSWISNNGAGAFGSPLKWSVAGGRSFNNGTLYNDGGAGYYWSSTVSVASSRFIYFDAFLGNATMNNKYRAYGLSVRCLKD